MTLFFLLKIIERKLIKSHCRKERLRLKSYTAESPLALESDIYMYIYACVCVYIHIYIYICVYIKRSFLNYIRILATEIKNVMTSSAVGESSNYDHENSMVRR